MKLRSAHLRRVRALLGVVCIWVGVSAVLLAIEAPRGAADVNSISLFGAGSPNVFKQLTGWQNDMLAATQPVDVNYIGQLSGPLARADFVNGSYDYIISGTPFSADQLALMKANGVSVIAAPVQVTAAAVVMLLPTVNNSDGTVTWAIQDKVPGVPAGCGLRGAPPCTTPPQLVTYPGLHIPQRGVAELLLSSYLEPDGSLQPFWSSTEVLNSMTYGIPPTPLHLVNLVDPFNPTPVAIDRSEPSDDTYYLELAASETAPEVWASAHGSGKVGATPSEKRIEYVFTRPGVFAPVPIIGSTVNPLTNKQVHAGIAAFLPPSAVADARASFPRTPFVVAEVPNARGDWVAPTPDSISAAIAGGHGAPLFGLKETVPGVYPLAWVNNIYVRASGLSIDKTNALAGLIRYLATDGQASAASFGEGHLSPELVTNALVAADQLVSSNCAGTDRIIVKAQSSAPYAPDGPALSAALASYGQVLQCSRPPTPPTTTTTAIATTSVAPTSTVAPTTTIATTTTAAATRTTSTTFVPTTTIVPRTFATRPNATSPRITISTTAPPTTSPSTTPTRAPTTTAANTTTSPPTGISTPRTVPLPIPLRASAVGGFDRISTALLGGALVLVGRLLLRRRVGQSGSLP